MDKSLTRRRVLQAGAGFALAKPALAIPGIFVPSGTRPIVISSGNGHSFRNGGDRTCVEEAFYRLEGDLDPLDAVVAGVNIVELDPTDISVGYGGLPNADGIVQLDSCCMHGAKGWAGGVAALEGVKTPSLVAKAVAEGTDHHLLAGEGARTFAKLMGLEVIDDLNTETSRKLWLEWKRRTDGAHYLDPHKRDTKKNGLPVALQSMVDDGLVDPMHVWGTINCSAMNAKGELAGVTTTSGLAFKIPGRVGDSPVLGAGLYVDGKVGAAGSTGRGESNLYNCSCFLIVEELRRGAHPKDAGLAAMRRIKQNLTEKRLLDEDGNPNFGMEYYVLDAKGRHAGISTGAKSRYAVCDENGARFESCEFAWQ